MKIEKWMEQYRGLIIGNGDRIESTCAKPALVQVNAPLALIQTGIEAQIALLRRLKSRGLLRDLSELLPDPESLTNVFARPGGKVESLDVETAPPARPHRRSRR